MICDTLGGRLHMVRAGRRLEFTLPDASRGAVEDGEAGNLLTAPMPGRVIKVFVTVGERVTKGQPLAVLEAMKMEQRFEAPRDGVVTALHIREGDQVSEGTQLLDLGEVSA